jgi:hypothetical protein
MTSTTTYYVSITGIKLKSIWYFAKFQRYSGPSMTQAQSAEGNLSAQGNYRNGILHTRSVWKDRKSMMRFMASGAHAKAMKINDEVSVPNETKVYGYETDKIPTWDEAISLWEEHGTRHGVKPKKNGTKQQTNSATEKEQLWNSGTPRLNGRDCIIWLLCIWCLLEWSGVRTTNRW